MILLFSDSHYVYIYIYIYIYDIHNGESTITDQITSETSTPGKCAGAETIGYIKTDCQTYITESEIKLLLGKHYARFN